jgi:hypothetical protein
MQSVSPILLALARRRSSRFLLIFKEDPGDFPRGLLMESDLVFYTSL